MSERDDIRAAVRALLDRTRREMPATLQPRMAPSPRLGGEPEWLAFEWALWDLGEQIRQLLLRCAPLRAERDVQEEIIEIATDRRAHRGRQPFVMLLGYKACARHAARLADELVDPCVDGHVIQTLYRMKAPGFTQRIALFAEHPKTWVRNEAKRYLAWDGPQ